jgi:hypothetical protein
MHSVKLTMFKILTVIIVACGSQMSVTAQENSPYSRYALGDLTPNQNVFTRGMGGISAGVADNRSINFTNPASLTLISNTIFDIGTEIDIRTLKRTTPADKFTSANTFVSYLQMAFPLTTRKMTKKDMAWALSFGLKPVTKINYKILENIRTGIDSMSTLYEGDGGSSQAFLGTGFKYKDFSIGINAGYMFGSKDISSVRRIVNDSIFYYTSNSSTKTTFGNFFISGGMQYDIALARDARQQVTKNLRVGVYGNFQQNLKANSDIKRETIFFDQSGLPIRLDSIYEEAVKGTIILPAMGGIGFSYQDVKWLIGADFEYGNWANYRYYGQEDQVQNSWTFRAGTQYYPAKLNTPVKKYFNFVKYRAGLYYGSDYIKLKNNRPSYGFTIGTGMPLTTLKRMSYTGEYVVLNTAFEFGNRGNKQSNIRETIYRFNIGISMNARWFQKSKYN